MGLKVRFRKTLDGLVGKISGRKKRLIKNRQWAEEMSCKRWEDALRRGKKKDFVGAYYKKHTGKANIYALVYRESMQYFLSRGFGENNAHRLAQHVGEECRKMEGTSGISAESRAGHKYAGFLAEIGGVAREYFEKHEAEIGNPRFLEIIREDAYNHISGKENFGKKKTEILARNIKAECGQILRVRGEAEKYLEKYAGRLGEKGILETIYAEALQHAINDERRPEKAAGIVAGRIRDECEMLIKRRAAGGRG